MTSDARPVVGGVCTAAWLQRAALPVCVIDRQSARDAASPGNAGCINGSSVVPIALPGVLRHVPDWLLQPDGPLVLRWRYLPRMVRSPRGSSRSSANARRPIFRRSPSRAFASGHRLRALHHCPK